MTPENFDIPRIWRLRKQRYSLIGEICSNETCRAKIFPPRDLCPECGEHAHELYKFSGKGKVYSFTKKFDVPEGQTPYYLAMLDLEEGPRITAQLTDLDPDVEVEIGMPVEMVTRILNERGGDRGLIPYGYKFRPPVRAETSSSPAQQ